MASGLNGQVGPNLFGEVGHSRFYCRDPRGGRAQFDLYAADAYRSSTSARREGKPVTDSESFADLTTIIDSLKVPTAEPAQKARLLVATDWTRGAIPLTALRAFRALVPPSAPIQLVFTVPDEPTVADAACVNVLVEELGTDHGVEGLELESFAEASTKPYDSALVPVHDEEENIAQLGSFILRMRGLVRRHETSLGSTHRGHSDDNVGDLTALRSRLDEFPRG